MSDTCRRFNCEEGPRGGGGVSGLFCSDECETAHEHVKDDRPTRSEPADFGGGESTGVQEL